LYIVLKADDGADGDGDGVGDEGGVILKLTVLQLSDELNPWFNPGIDETDVIV
jgi:hypothetical protein